MFLDIKAYFSGKKILILGFGIEGVSTYRFLRKIFPDYKIAIADMNAGNPEILKIKDDTNLVLYLGENYSSNIEEYDIVIKTPGISLKSLPVSNYDTFTSHTELFLRFFRNQIIGITGTKGKSTTATLIYHIIHSVRGNCILVGNIGKPPFDLVDEINEDTIIVYELSSHQLEQTRVSPHIAVFLNIFQEHLDHYESFEKYKEAKFRIAEFQEPGDFLIYNFDDLGIREKVRKNGLKSKLLPYSLNKEFSQGCFLRNRQLCYKDSEPEEITGIDDISNIPGEHNVLNIMAAINAIRCRLPMDALKISESLMTFRMLEHRLEHSGKFNGIIFYNDSISTVPESTIAAIKALPDTDTVILGGFDRGVDYDKLIDFLEFSRVNNLIFIGEAGKRMLKLYKSRNFKSKKTFYVYSMEEAVTIAKRHTLNDKICLLSPAAASYDMFNNFAERGLFYKRIIKNN